MEQEFVCSLCIFKPKEPSPDNDDRLTIISGHLVCVDHQGYIPGPVIRSVLLSEPQEISNERRLRGQPF